MKLVLEVPVALKPTSPLPPSFLYSNQAASIRSVGTALLTRADILIGVFGETPRNNEGPLIGVSCWAPGVQRALQSGSTLLPRQRWMKR